MNGKRHYKPLTRRTTTTAKTIPEPGVNAIISRYADTCHDTDIAFMRGYLTIGEVQQARAVARIIRDASLMTLRLQGGRP